jgi:hypothetical protein
LQGKKPNGIIASLDVESLFTNVPVSDTIDIILESEYANEDLAPPCLLPRQIMEELLSICTTEAPFRHIDGGLFRQADGVAMGFPQ